MQPGFFDFDSRYEQISQMGDPLEKLNTCIPWHEFRIPLKKIHGKEKKNKVGRKPYDVILMFKILILQELYNLSDNRTEYMIRDRLSFMRFLELNIEDTIPDEKTIWLFRERLTKAGLMKTLFEQFDRYLNSHGFSAHKGQIIEASIIPVPKQRNSRKENKQIKNGALPKDWTEHPNRLKQKDIYSSQIKIKLLILIGMN